MKLSASQAAKETGLSIPTITRAIKSSKMSAERVEGGGYLIDPAELFRVFPPVTSRGDATPSMSGRETPNVTGVLEAKLEMLKEYVAKMEAAMERDRREKADVIDDLRQDRDHWRNQAEAITRQLAPPAPVEVPKQQAGGRRSWWPFSRANDAR